MKIFTEENQPQVSKKYQANFSDFSLSEIKVPDYNEYIGTIYMFVNNINGKIYIGQTMTKFYSRFCSHNGDSFTKKDNLPFHKAIRKYGWESFSRYIIWQDSTIYEHNQSNKKLVREILDKKEIEFIKQYSSDDSNFGYNLTSGGSYLPQSAYYREAIEKAKETKKINKTNHMLGKIYDQHHLAKHVLQYDLNGNFIKEWSCIKLAEDTLDISITIKGTTSGNYIWILDTDNKDFELSKKLELLSKTPKRPGVKKVIYCFDLFGEFIGSYNSASEAGAIFNISSSQISHAAAAKENGNVVQDYIWIYEEDLEKKEIIINSIREKSKIYKSKYKPIYQIYLNGAIIKLWDNFETLINEYPQIRVSVNKCLNNKLNVYCNCFWIYEDEYSDDLLIDKLENYRKTKKTLVEDILNGVVKYEGLEVKHDTNSNKNYLKKHPCIYQLDKQYNIIKKWGNYKDVKNEGLNFDNISKCLRRKLKTAYGYIWRFEEDILNNNLE